ncbi:hypothetical protein LRD69_08775 [Streptomyces sp. JH14]|uniref:hypothetical protein n=1 Tax=Streptomyces sp. JH14 TaxID=2793630 RepID=UPI0023F8D16C|nr:hypothetical protein [Streptomyces sp. JH14]MDF6042256.1 hypothetical protein [Streptomyces sp. JH14]
MATKLRFAIAAAVIGAALAAPQAAVAQEPIPGIAKTADAGTRSFAQANSEAVAAAATACGAGYDTVARAIPLPEGTDPQLRLATLFTYINASGKGCAILDNNVGASRYMYLKICKLDGTGCDTDSGNFSEYAGPVYVSSVACAKTTAKMGTSSSSLFINYNSEYAFPCN